MQLNNSLSLVNGSSFFRKLTQLEIVDLSSNDLSGLQATAFKTCPQLKTINLSKNKFMSIPINLQTLPNLQELDMSDNSLLSLSVPEMTYLDDHVKRVPNVSLHLAGNLLSCGCSNIKFLVWLKYTSVHLDLERDYPCIDQNDHLIKTQIQLSNLEALWRVCSGEQSFFVSIILLTVMILCYLSCFFFIHFQTVIMSSLIGLFTRNFTLKAQSDYRYGAFIGYSDQDYRFACFTTRRYLEDVLKVTTYVRDRDLIPATDMAESIIEAINSSWRVLLLVSEDFLRHEHWAFFTMKAAVYCVEPLNPKRVVLLVERRSLERVPLSLLRIVPEENIIVLDKPFTLGLDDRELLSKIMKL